MVRRRLRSYALLFVSLLGLMVALPVLVQAQTNPWSTAVHNNTWFPNRACTQPLRIKPLGNSITRGFGSDGPGTGNEENVLYNHGWRAYLDAALTAQGYQFDFTGQLVHGQSSGLVFDYDHDGFGGIRADQIRDGINNTFMFNGTHPPLLPTTPADVVLLHIGTNDLAQNQDAASTVNDVAGILDEIDAYDTEVVVIVALIVDQKPGDPNYLPGRVSSYNNALETMVNNRITAGDKLILVDMFHALTYPDDMFDWLHPNEAGYDKMDDVWLAQLLTIWPTCVAITSTPGTSASANEPYTYDVDAISDPQLTPIVYSLLTSPAGMVIDPASGVITWTPNSSQAGFHPVEVKASNSNGTDTQNFTVEVVNPLVCLAADPVAYWPLDESSGTTFADLINANDASCSGASCPSFASGQVNGARYFDGVDDGLDVADSYTLDWGSNDSFSIQAWVKTSQLCTGNKVYVGKFRDNSGKGDWWLGCDNDNNKAAFYLRDSNDIVYKLKGTTALNDGNWHHLVAIRDASVGVNRLYVDGMEEGAATVNYTGNFANDNPLTIGNYTPLNLYLVDGLIDEVAIHGRALSLAEIQNHYNTGLAGKNYCELTSPSIISTPVTGVVPGSTYTYDVESIGNPVPTFSLVSGPTGMIINPNTGVITWSAVGETSGTSYTVEVKANNSVGSDNQLFTLIVYYPNYLPVVLNSN